MSVSATTAAKKRRAGNIVSSPLHHKRNLKYLSLRKVKNFITKKLL